MDRIDPFAAWILSVAGVELPLSLEQQSLLISLLGVYVLFSALLIMMLLLYGLGACWEGSPCCRARGAGPDGFLVLDEKTDMEAAAFQALAKAELIDGTPRLATYQYVYDDTPGPVCAPSPPPDYGTPPPQTAMGFAPASARRSRSDSARGFAASPVAGLAVPSAAPAYPSGVVTARASGAASPFAPPSGGAATDRPVSPTLAQLSSRRGTPRPDLGSGWRDKDSPSWYGV